MQIFGQVWLWSLGSFLLGALFTWLLLVRPARKRVAELEEMPPRRFEPQQPPQHQPSPQTQDKSLDDLFDKQRAAAAAVPPLPPLPPLQPMAPPGPPVPSGPPISQPSPIQGRLDTTSSGPSGPTAPPEPPIHDDNDTELSDNPFQRFTESTTVFVPPANLPTPPPVIEPSGEDWFVKEEAPDDPSLITDVEDDERVDDGGTIFTQHTTPIPAEMIRSLDEQTPPPRAEEEEAVQEDEPAAAEEPALDQPVAEQPAFEQPASEQPAFDQPAVEQPAMDQPAFEQPERVAAHAYEPEPERVGAHAYEPQQSNSSRSLFEPIVPAAHEAESDEADFVPPGPFGPGSAMPLPGGGSPAPEFNVKASVTALRYCTQENPQFDRIVAEVWFKSPSDAERVGFRGLS